MKFFTNKKKTADKEIAAGRDDEKQEDQNLTEDDMDEESLANGRDNVIEVKRTMGKKGKMLLAIAAIVVVLGLVTALLRYNAIKTYTQYDVVSATETSGDNIADYSVFAGNVNCGVKLTFAPWLWAVLYGGILVLYFIINRVLVGRLNKIVPAEVLKNRE